MTSAKLRALVSTAHAPRRRARAVVACAAKVLGAFALIGGAGSLAPAIGKTPEITITPDRALQFGTFMAFGSGSRTVSVSGAVVDQALVALEGALPAPARFTLAYDRGNGNNHVLDIEIELVFSQPPRVRVGGVEGTVSGFQTDLPGAAQINPGQAIRVYMRNCRSRVCTRSFQVGGRLDVTRLSGGADLAIPLPVDATVISVERQR
jgi:Domain of unknown function (DUF4402)